MFKKLGFNERVSSMLAATVIAALALLLCLSISMAPRYSDFIVGYITWHAETKFQDLVAVPVFIVALFCALLFLSSVMQRQRRLFGEGSTIEFSNQLMWWSLPSVAVMASMVLGAQPSTEILFISVFGVGFVALSVTVSAMKNVYIDPRVFGLGALGVILIVLIQVELALVLGRAPLLVVGDVDLLQYVRSRQTYAIAIFGWLACLATVYWNPRDFSQKIYWLLLAGQLGLSAFYLTLYPARLQQLDGPLSKYETTVWLKILVVGMLIWSVVDVIRRFRKYSSSDHLTKLLSPVAFFGLLVGLKAGNTVFPNINPDDYHFGESLLGWWSYLQGVIPYIGYMPAHGIIGDDFTQLLSFVFYDGSAGSIMEAHRLSFAILAFAAFLSIYYFSGSIGLAFVAIFFMVGLLNWLFLTPFLCLWLSHTLRLRPTKWFIVWGITAPIVILGVPPQGLLLVTASGIMAAYYAWHIWRNPEQGKLIGILITVAALVVLGIATPLGMMLFGAVRYVLENGSSNQVAYGVPWHLSWSVGANKGFLFETVRMSWIAIPLTCLLLIHAWSKDCNRRLEAILPLFVVLLFTLLLIPYSMGRIDPGEVSRPGLAASFGWAVLLPVAAWGIIGQGNKVPMIVITATLGALLGFAPLSINSLITSASATVSTPALRDGASAGLPNIGRASVQEEHWTRLTKLARVLAEKVPAGATYLDLTSRNAQYFYLGYRPILPVTAPYNMVSPGQQQRAVEILRARAPSIALLEGANIIHDGGGLALRNPYLYRFIVDNYDPAYVNGFILGYKKGISSASSQPQTIEISLKDFTDVNWEHGIHRNTPALYVDDPVLFPLIKIGDRVLTTTGEVRRIHKVDGEGQSLWLEGSSFTSSGTGPVSGMQLVAGPEVISEYRMALLQKAFAQPDILKIPVAWGKSEQSLAKKMTLIHPLGGLQPVANQLIAENGRYRVSGVDPFLSFDFAGLNISGHDAGLLRFEFECSGRRAEPRIQVFWWGDDHEGPFEASSIRFNAEDGVLIVPLDASPRWLTLARLKGVRVDLDNAAACESIQISNIVLMQRKF